MMILDGNQRGGAKDLALHLLKPENEHAEVHAVRGFSSDNLVCALNEAYAISRGTQCKQFLFSLSVNPPSDKNVKIADFDDAIEKVEAKLGLTDQPRAIVFHEKHGRRHAHAVWSRIDALEMKAIHLSHYKWKLGDVSRELFLKHGWDMPSGLVRSEERDPRNFTLAEWQQAKRSGKHARDIKTIFQDCWAISDSQAAFASALKERGFTLARGDSRGFVALDIHGKPFSVAKWVGIRAKEVRAKLTGMVSLPSIEKAKTQIADEMATHLRSLKTQQSAAIQVRLSDLEDKRENLTRNHKAERQALSSRHQRRCAEETKLRQSRLRTGLRGLLDRVTGRYGQIKRQNEREASEAMARDRAEKDALIFVQLEARRRLQSRIENLKRFERQRGEALDRDIGQFEAEKTRLTDNFTKRAKPRTPKKPRPKRGSSRRPER